MAGKTQQTPQTMITVQAICQAKEVEDALKHIAFILDLPVPRMQKDTVGVVVVFGSVCVVRISEDVVDVPAHVLNKLIFHTPLKWSLQENTCKCAHDRVSENRAVALGILKEKGINTSDVQVVGLRMVVPINGEQHILDLTDDRIHHTLAEALG